MGEKDGQENPTDRGKKGVKRSVLTEGGGVPIAVVVAGANKNDFKLVKETIQSVPIERPAPTPEKPQGMCMDKGYDYDEVRALLCEFGFTAHIRARGEEAQAIKKEAGYKARRCVVERTHSLDEPLPPDTDLLGEEAGELPGIVAPGVCLHRFRTIWPTGIGSNSAEQNRAC